MATGSFVQAQVTENAAAKAVFQVILEVSEQHWGFIAPDAAIDYIENVNPFILDVRTPKEWDETGVIPGAVTIPLTELEQHLAELPPLNKPILVYCAAGARGQYALTYLKTLGYKNVKNLKGGFTAWAKAGLPVEKK
ncbi:rhodanese-like domain-containing protein [Oceanithermus sp.]